jgi:hypothetical protein
MKPSAAGKGDDCRIGNFKEYQENYDRIFGKKKENKYMQEFADKLSSESVEIPVEAAEVLRDNFWELAELKND